jgi:hypothetical protein
MERERLDRDDDITETRGVRTMPDMRNAILGGAIAGAALSANAQAIGAWNGSCSTGFYDFATS